MFHSAQPVADPKPSPVNFAAAGQLCRVLFATTVFPTLPPSRLVGLGNVDEALGSPGLSLLPAFMTHACFEEARQLEVAVSPLALITDPLGAVLASRLPCAEDGQITLGMARLTQEFVRGMFAAMQTPPPLLLKLDEAAELMRLSPSTLKHMVSDGRIRKSVRRGTPLVFVRDLLVQEWMGGS
jgi:hypothetical protein